MNLPSYTAESALYRSRTVYREPGDSGDWYSLLLPEAWQGGSEYVEPAAGTHCFFTIEPRQECCLQPDGRHVCTPIPPSCPPGTAVCHSGGGCQSLDTNENCGACGVVCRKGLSCYEGRCQQVQPSGCPVNFTRCGTTCCVPGSTCVNHRCQCSGTQPPAISCGNCGTTFSSCSYQGKWTYAPCSGEGACAAGSRVPCGLGTQTCSSNCQWESCDCPFTTCNGTCVDTTTDLNNCGGCGFHCSSGNCCNGVCCAPGETCCNGACVSCPHGGSCSGTSCVCPSGTADCGGICTDTIFDRSNCGGCGFSCTSPDCCDGTCTDVSSDASNCGICRNACPTNNIGVQLTCQSGVCDGCPQPMSLGSSTNYVLFNNCQPIPGLTVSFTSWEDINANVTPGPLGGSAETNGGFSMQLNAWAKQNSQFTAMQFTLEVGGGSNGLFGTGFDNQMVGRIEYWNCISTGCTEVTPSSIDDAVVINLPSNTIPASSTLSITLNTDSSDNVTSATFTVTTPSSPNNPPVTTTIPTNFLAPIEAFTLVFVGPDGGRISTFTSGSGAITYAAGNGTQLCVQDPAMPCPSQRGTTVETSNASYSAFDPWSDDSLLCCGTTLSQRFNTPT